MKFEYKNRRWQYRLIAIIIIIGMSYLLSYSMPKLFPEPHLILQNMWDKRINFSKHIFFSFQRLLYSLIISIIISIPIGVTMGFFSKINKALSPFLYLFYPIPKLALLPMVMLIFGLGDLAKIILMISIVIFPMIMQIRDSVMNMEKSLFEPYITLGISPLSLLIRIVLKGILPAVLSSSRIGIGTALSVLFFAENFGTDVGIGYYIMDAWMRINYIDMYAGIIWVSILGISLFAIIDLIEKFACPWNKH